MPTAKECHTLTSVYEKKYKEHYGNMPVVNRHQARWSWDSVLQGLSMQESKELIDYYFKTKSTNRHSLQWFFYNYDKLIEGRQASLDDSEHRSRLRKESFERAQEWRQRFGNQGITDDQLGTEE